MTQTQKKPSFFRRISSSTGSTPSKTDAQHASASKSPDGRTPGIAGTAYERLPVNVGPFVKEKRVESNGSLDKNAIPERVIRASSNKVDSTALHGQRPSDSIPITRAPLPRLALSQQQYRSPIHPALASPPNSPPRQAVPSASYDTARLRKPLEEGKARIKEDTSTRPGHSSLVPALISIPPRPSYQTVGASGSSATPLANSLVDPRLLLRSESRYHDADAQLLSSAASPGVATPRAVISTRRSTRGTPTGKTVPSSGPPMSLASTPDANSAHLEILPAGSVMSEAKAYARAVSSHLGSITSSNPPLERAYSRPLPQPPGPRMASQTSIHVIASSEKDAMAPARKSRKPLLDPSRSTALDSVTAPPLLSSKPRIVSQSSVSEGGNVLRPMVSPRTPPKTDRRKDHAAHSGLTVRPKTKNPLLRRGPASLAFVLGHVDIQNALLPWLTINSFLSRTGSAEVVRNSFSGETVGRWIMKQWGITVDKERGRSWPNITVWEGFLESLLHDPASYHTYPPQWHSLLQHLSLSHTLIVLHLRSLPQTVFPYPAPLPFEDDPSLPYSHSLGSLSSLNLSRSRIGSMGTLDIGSMASIKMPRKERVMEVIMPEPLAAQPQEKQLAEIAPIRRRGSISSLASVASVFGRRRASSVVGSDKLADSAAAAPMATSGKASLPPVSYPNAKRYGFTRHGDPAAPRSQTSSSSSRPGSMFSKQSTPSVISQRRWISRQSLAGDRINGLMSNTANPRASFASSDARSSAFGGQSPIESRRPRKIEPAFDRPAPYIQNRAPVLRVFVPLSNHVRRWPSAEGAVAAVRELDKCGASQRLKLGDLVVNKAIRQPKTTEHVLVFVPFVRHLLVPLEYTHSAMGHLPKYINAFVIAPSYFYPFLPAPQIVYLDLSPYAEQITRSLRLAHDRRDLVVTSGAVLSAKRYLHVAGFEVTPGDNAALEWHGMVSLEAEGTTEGKKEIERRASGYQGPWEVNKDKSMEGMISLRLIKEETV